MADRPQGKPINNVLQYLTNSVKGWFNPGTPIPPAAPEGTELRSFDYPVNVNTIVKPRDNENVSFHQLRALADGYYLLRMAIETRKDQIEKLPWTVKTKQKRGESLSEYKARSVGDNRIDDLIAFFNCPDGENTWNEWLRILLEDLLVIDAPCIEPRKDLSGKLVALDIIDGATIKRIIDVTGRTPEAPLAAYQQIIKGLPAIDLTKDDIIYRPRNKRSNKIYGYSPVETVVSIVNLAIRRYIFQLNFYTEGNVPEAVVSLPASWKLDQVKQFQAYFDSLMAGDLATRRKMIFLPSMADTGKADIQFTKEAILKDQMDEWLARIIMFAFSLPATPFVNQMSRASAQTVQQTALSEGLYPMMSWIKSLMNFVINKHFGYDDIEFEWVPEKESDQLKQAQIFQLYATANILTTDEIREELGYEPMKAEDKKQPAPVGTGLPGQPTQPIDQSQANQSGEGGRADGVSEEDEQNEAQ